LLQLDRSTNAAVCHTPISPCRLVGEGLAVVPDPEFGADVSERRSVELSKCEHPPREPPFLLMLRVNLATRLEGVPQVAA